MTAIVINSSKNATYHWWAKHNNIQFLRIRDVLKNIRCNLLRSAQKEIYRYYGEVSTKGEAWALRRPAGMTSTWITYYGGDHSCEWKRQLLKFSSLSWDSCTFLDLLLSWSSWCMMHGIDIGGLLYFQTIPSGKILWIISSFLKEHLWKKFQIILLCL